MQTGDPHGFEVRQTDDDTLAGVLSEPTGNLRCTDTQEGRTLIVGFDQATYEALY